MKTSSRSRHGLRWLAAGIGLAASAYAANVAVTWYGYGRAPRGRPEEEDPLLDRFIPSCDVVERHNIRVAAPADVTLDAAREMDLFHIPLIRAIFKAREIILGVEPDDRPRPRGLLAEVLSLGWIVLAELPGREIVVGAVTRPWEPNVTFRPVPPEAFAAFAEPDYVKIVWTLRADPVAERESIFRTETRAVATDAAAREKFRPYWSFLSPGIRWIRWMSLGPLKADAERRAGPPASSFQEAEFGTRWPRA